MSGDSPLVRPIGIGGLEATEAIVASVPDVKVIILTQYENRERGRIPVNIRPVLRPPAAATS